MKFSLISDMHVDFPQPKTPYADLEELVVVAGDTSNGLHGMRFLQKLRNKGYRVVAVDGNHEHYANNSQGRSVLETTARFREEYPDVVNYHRNEPTFILRNGWYKVRVPKAWATYMNDHVNCVLSPEECNLLAQQDAQFIEDRLTSLQMLGMKAVVVTHTAPCEETLDPKFEGAFSNEWYVNPYMTPLLGRYKDTILVWCHGHTHAPNEAIVDGVRVVCNPRGYPGENPQWKPLTIEVQHGV